jgi:hypothetical protein
MRHTKRECKKGGLHCDFLVQRFASSKSLENTSTAISYLQFNKYTSFAKLLNGKMERQIVVVVRQSVKVRFYNRIFVITLMGASLKENCPIDDEMYKVGKGAHIFRVQGTK